MKNNVYFVNTSRGEVIDEKALLINLNNKKIKAASIDVLSNEQSMDLSNNNLVNYARNNDNLIITPHIAGLTYESEEIAAQIALENIKNKIK